MENNLGIIAWKGAYPVFRKRFIILFILILAEKWTKLKLIFTTIEKFERNSIITSEVIGDHSFVFYENFKLRINGRTHTQSSLHEKTAKPFIPKGTSFPFSDLFGFFPRVFCGL